MLTQLAILKLTDSEFTRLSEDQFSWFTFADDGTRLPGATNEPRICVLTTGPELGLPAEIVGFGVVRRGQRVTTSERRLHVELAFIFAPIAWAPLANRLPPPLHRHLEERASGGFVPEKTSHAFISILKEHSQEFDRWLGQVRQLYVEPRPQSAHERRIVAQQADATNMALRLGGIYNDRDLQIAMRADSSAPFLVDLDSGRSMEDTVVMADWASYFDWEAVDPSHSAVRTYEAPNGRQISLVYANRTSIENSTGVDLVYFRHRPAGYLLVQYKMYGEQKPLGRASFDKQFRKELKLMRRIDSASLQHQNANCVEENGFRLSAAACYVKICRRSARFEPNQPRLVSGDVVPAEHLSHLARAGLKSFTSDDIDFQRMSASVFLELAGSGLFGTCGPASTSLTRFLRDSLRDGRRAILAFEGEAI